MGLLETNGLSQEILMGLSYQSRLGKSLKNNLNAFEKKRSYEMRLKQQSGSMQTNF